MTDLLAGVLLRYLELSLLIALAFLLFRSLRALAERSPLQLGSQGMSRVGRVVFLAAVLSPFLAHALIATSDTSGAPQPTRAAQTPPAGPALSEGLRGESRLTAERLLPTGYDGARSFSRGLDPRQIELAVALATMFLLSGFAVSGLRTVARLRDLRALVRETVLLRRLGRVSIVVSDRARVPFSTTVLGRAHVVLPVELLEDAVVLRVALRHELQHYRRSDPLWAVALELFRLLFFWHPAARGWVRELSDLQEFSCDEALVRRGVPAKDYGTCLLRVAEMAVEQRMVASTAMATDRGAHLRRRIDMLFQYDRNEDSRRWSFGLCVSAVVVILATAIASAGALPSADDLATDTSTATWYTDDPLAWRIEALTRDNDVTLDALVAKPEDESGTLGGMPFEVRLTAGTAGLEPVLAWLTLEPDLSIASLTMEMPQRAEPAHRIQVTLDLRVHKERNATEADPAELREEFDLIRRSLELFVQEEISELRLTLDGDATLFVKNRNGDCLTDFPEDPSADLVLREMLQPVAPATPWREAPDLEFETTSGSKVRLSSLRGRVVLVDFWASWCRPCEEEVLQLKALERELGSADFEIVGVSLSENQESFEEFVADHQVPWPQRHEDGGWSSTAARAFEVRAIPSHFLVDRNGRYIQVPLGSPEHLARTAAELINK